MVLCGMFWHSVLWDTLCDIVWYGMVSFCFVRTICGMLSGMVWYCVLWFGVVEYGMVWCDVMSYGVV